MDRKSRKKEFYNICRKHIIPLLTKFESHRKKEMTKILIFNILFLLFILPFFLFVFTSLGIFNIDELKGYNALCVLIPTLISDYFLFLSLKTNKNFLKYIKKQVSPKVWALFPDLEYIEPKIEKYYTGCCDSNIKNEISIDDIAKSSMFDQIKNKKTDDAFLCSYKNVKAQIEETHLYIPNNRGKDYTVFRGVLFYFPLKKNVKGKTIVIKKERKFFAKSNDKLPFLFLLLPIIFTFIMFKPIFKSFSFTSMSLITILFPIFVILIISFDRYLASRKKDLSNVRLEDVEFMRDFKVLSDNQLESRFLLTPAFMDRLKNLRTAFGNNNMRCSFFNNSLMVAIENNEDLFEIGNVFVPLNNYKSLIKFYNQLYSVYEMIDYLHIDE